MSLDYDNQVACHFTPELFLDPVIAPVLNRLGIHLDSKGNKVILFTSEETVYALKHADEQIKDVLRASGIGMISYASANSPVKKEFLKSELHRIIAEYPDNSEAQKYAIFEVLMFLTEETKRGADDGLFPCQYRSIRRPEPFNLGEALMAMITQLDKPADPDHYKVRMALVENPPPDEPMRAAPKPAPGIFGRIAAFGRRRS